MFRQAACSTGMTPTAAICRGGAMPEPYRTWVSEIMLQQTRVAAVLGALRALDGTISYCAIARSRPRAIGAGDVERTRLLPSCPPLASGSEGHCTRAQGRISAAPQKHGANFQASVATPPQPSPALLSANRSLSSMATLSAYWSACSARPEWRRERGSAPKRCSIAPVPATSTRP